MPGGSDTADGEIGAGHGIYPVQNGATWRYKFDMAKIVRATSMYWRFAWILKKFASCPKNLPDPAPHAKGAATVFANSLFQHRQVNP